MQVLIPSVEHINSYQRQLSKQSYQVLQVKAQLENCAMQELPYLLSLIERMQTLIREQENICEQIYSVQ